MSTHTFLAGLMPRRGTRPATRVLVPHLQTEQFAEPVWAERLVSETSALAGTRQQESRFGSADSVALALHHPVTSGPADAFFDDHEFCLLHAPPGGGVHLTLPTEHRLRIIELGWAEPHPLAGIAAVPVTLVLVYAPRDEEELRVVLAIIRASHSYACGGDH